VRRVAVIVVVLAAAGVMGWYAHGRGGAGEDPVLHLVAVRRAVAPLRARRVDLMSLQLARQPEELRRYGAVICKLHHDALPKGAPPTTDAVRTVACQRTSARLSVVATDPGPALEHDPAAVARLVDQAYDRLR
jgi:hypothetical protein